MAKRAVTHHTRVRAGGRWYYSALSYDDLAAEVTGAAQGAGAVLDPYLHVETSDNRRTLISRRAIVSIEELPAGGS